MLSVDRLIIGRSRWARRGTDCTETPGSQAVPLSCFTLFTADLLSDLLAVVAVVDQKVLLKRQLLLPISKLDQGHISREVFPCLVYMVQEGRRAVENHLYLLVTASSMLP